MIVVKLGGSIIRDLHPSTIPDIKNVFAREKLVLVHGGGKM